MRPHRIYLALLDDKDDGPHPTILDLPVTMSGKDCGKAIALMIQRALNGYGEWWERKLKQNQKELF